LGDISKKALINAPIEAVFKYVSDPHNAPSFISSITRIISGPQGAPSEGQVWQAEANFLGRRGYIRLRLAEMRPNQVVRFTIEGEPQATLALRLSPDDGARRTQVSLLLDVPSIPSIFLNGFMGGLLEGDIARLKRAVET
jgi:uncharacterized protein YndB with AHSA1/START domain